MYQKSVQCTGSRVFYEELYSRRSVMFNEECTVFQSEILSVKLLTFYLSGKSKISVADRLAEIGAKSLNRESRPVFNKKLLDDKSSLVTKHPFVTKKMYKAWGKQWKTSHFSRKLDKWHHPIRRRVLCKEASMQTEYSEPIRNRLSTEFLKWVKICATRT